MTALFDLGTQDSDTDRAQRVLDDAQADHGFRIALDHAEQLGGRDGLRRLQNYTRQIAASESKILADHVLDDGNTRRAERLLNDGRTSRREQRRKASRARVVGKNTDLAAKLADGDLSEEQLDIIADASAKSDGDAAVDAAVDAALIEQVAAVPPEQGKTIADDYLAKRATPESVQTEHDRQRALRRASKYHSKKDGLDTISLQGDGVASKTMWDAIDRRADEIYTRDGGSDLPASAHPRTSDQRKFDAAFELITGQTTTPDGRTHPAATPTGANGSRKTANAPAKPSKRYTPAKPRPQIVISLTIDKPLGLDPAAVATQHGLGLIPDSVLANYAAHADILAALFDRDGEPLWLARLRRSASNTQMVALILRDRGCVLCGADPSKCQAHHTMPWSAPGKGRTDLDDLLLLCGPCHRLVHAESRTIYQDRKGAWRTRTATPDELPAQRPDTTRNTVRLE